MSVQEPRPEESGASDSSGPPGSSEPSGGARLAALEGRLRLLLLHLAGRAVLARTEVDDLAQEVFLRAVAADDLPPHEPGDAPLYRYLSAIARHTVVDIARAIRAHKRDGREDRLLRSEWSRAAGVRASQVRSDGPGPSTRAAGAETGERLARGFQRLAADHRRVIGLRQFEGLSAAEAARRMGRSETAVHSLYRRALEAWEEASR